MGNSDENALMGKRLGPYRVESLLGEGAMARVYRGVHETLSRPVAIKMLKAEAAADSSLVERFCAEARAVNIIRHENIAECTDIVSDSDGNCYVVMELLEGRVLGQAIRDAGRIAPRRAVRIAVQIAEALDAAHKVGIVHRDLKPDNIFLIRRAGSDHYVKVLDFGVARLRRGIADVTATQSGALIGTPAYMSPEQVRGETAGPESDIYALGVVLFHTLTGRLPFDANVLSLMLMAHLNDTPPRVDTLASDVPAALVDVVDKALAKAASDRYPTMTELRRALLLAVDLPVDLNASLAAASAADAELPVVCQQAEISFDETLAPGDAVDTVGTTSLGGAASEIVTPAPAPTSRSRSWLQWGIIGAALAAAAVAIPMALRSDRDPAATPAAASPSLVAGADARAAPAPPLSAAVVAPSRSAADAGVLASPDASTEPAVARKPSGDPKRTKPATKKPRPPRRVAKPAASAPLPQPEVPREPAADKKAPEKRDLTKTLVDPTSP